MILDVSVVKHTTTNCTLFSNQLQQIPLTMNITLFSLFLLVALFTKSCKSEDGFTKEGEHWMNDGSVPNSKAALNAFTDTVFAEYEWIFKLQDAAAMAAKHTDDCVYIHQDLGILRGKEAVQKGYQELFKSGKASAKLMRIEASDVATLGDGFMHFIYGAYFFDKDNNKIGESVVFMVLKHVEDGYKLYLKAEITDLSKPFVWPPLL